MRKGTKRKKGIYEDDPLVPIKPFQIWLKDITKSIGCNEVARRVGVDERRVRTLIKGEEYNSGTKCKYKLNYIKLSTVEKFMMPFEGHPYLLYAYDEIDED